MKLSEIAKETADACRKAGQFIAGERSKVAQSDIEHKALNSLVSYVDKQAEQMLVESLSEIFPQAGFITEEDTPDQRDAEWVWVIDPLDGTTNYLHQITPYAVSVALLHHEREQVGVVYEIGQDEMFVAWRGGGSWLDERAIKVSRAEQLSQSLLATGFPYQKFTEVEPFMQMLSELFARTRGVRRLGSAATDLAYVACGRFEGFFESDLSSWDVAAGALLVQEAGGQVTDYRLGADYLYGGEIVATAPGVAHEFYQILQRHFFHSK